MTHLIAEAIVCRKVLAEVQSDVRRDRVPAWNKALIFKL